MTVFDDPGVVERDLLMLTSGLLVRREKLLLKQLITAMAAAGSSPSNQFNVWMKKESDTIQSLALAYTERIVDEQFEIVIQQ